MVHSMTGYGREAMQIGENTVTVEVRSTNHRYLDMNIHLPQPLKQLEDPMRKMIRHYFKRGRIDAYFHVEEAILSQKKLYVDELLMKDFQRISQQLKEEGQIQGVVTISDLLMIPDLIQVKEHEEVHEDIIDLLTESLTRACEQVCQAREKEAAELMLDIRQRIKYIARTITWIEKNMVDVTINYRKRVKQRIATFLDYEIIDEARLHQEIALLIERGDITEELTRLMSHVTQFQETVQRGRNIGRNLDFIAQEMHREINTVGSKAIDGKMSEKVVYMKSELEKIREQIQNIE